MKAAVVSYKNNQLAGCLAQDEFFLKKGILCNTFVKLNKLNIFI